MNLESSLRTEQKAPPGEKRRRPQRPTRDEGKDRIYGRNAVLAVVQGKRHVHSIVIAEGAGKDARLDEVRAIAENRRISLKTVDTQAIENIVGKVNHQGILATTDRYGYVPVRTILERPGTILVLDHVTDPQNLGALLRSGLAFDVAGVIIPSDRTASVTSAVVNSSAGAVERLPVAQVVNIQRALLEIKESGRWVVGLDTGEGSTSIFNDDIPLPAALVLGSEGRGISRQVRNTCDLLISIPISHQVESLNVAMAGSIALFELNRRIFAAHLADES